MRETVLPFKVEMTRDMITPHAGLALVGEFAVGLGVLKSVDRHLPKPGSGAGYGAHEYVFPMVLMLSDAKMGTLFLTMLFVYPLIPSPNLSPAW